MAEAVITIASWLPSLAGRKPIFHAQQTVTRLAIGGLPRATDLSTRAVISGRRSLDSYGELTVSVCNEGLSSRASSFSSRARRGLRKKIGAAQQADQEVGDLLTEDAETCEIVQGFNVTLGEGEDTFQGYFIQAIKNNNGVAVLFLSDILGFENGDNRDFAYRLACFGYNVLVPDLFRAIPWSKEKPQSDYEQWRGLHPPDRVRADIDVATEYLIQEIGGKLGVIGFCFGGGRVIETLARDSENLFSSGAFLYGTRFEASLGEKIKVPLLLIAGDSDALCPTETVRQLEKKVKGSKAKIYPGFGHAFAHHPNSAEEDAAAEDAFTEIRHWFHEHLLSDSAT